MRHAKHQRVTSLQTNKENEPALNLVTNLPSIKANPKHSLKNEYHINLNLRKKTYISLCTRKDAQGGRHGTKRSVESSRVPSEQTLNSHTSGAYLSSRGDRATARTATRPVRADRGDVLQNHQITPRMRAKMVDWLLEITQAYRCRDETLFLAIHLMDAYFRDCQRAIALTELHLVGVTCIFMACKYEEVHPIRLKTVIRDIAHNKIQAREIVAREAEILATLQFQLARKCLFLRCEQIINSAWGHEVKMQPIEGVLGYVRKMVCFDVGLLRNSDPEVLARACILAAIRLAPQSQVKLKAYENFIRFCGADYERIHSLCSQVLLLRSNFRTEFGGLQNINRLDPLDAEPPAETSA